MSERERDDHGRFAPVSPERFTAAFAGAAPMTTAEVAEAAGVGPATAAAKLESLREDGRVGRKELTVGEDRVDVWYLTTATLRDRLGAADVSADEVEETLASLEYPGASEMMRDWRRDAVRAAHEYLEEHGDATDDDLATTVYPAHSAGYDDSVAWLDFVRPRLRRLPGVVADEHAWRYTG